MRFQYLVHNSVKSAFLIRFVENKIGEIAEKYYQEDNYQLNTLISAPRGKSNNKKPAYMCEVILRPDDHEDSIIVRQSSPNMYKAIILARNALKARLSRMNRRQSNHQARRPDFQNPTATFLKGIKNAT